MFCLELQKLLKQVYDLTREGGQFIWEKEQQTSFGGIKHRFIKPLVLYLLNSTCRFQLYSDTSKFALEGYYIKYRIENWN